MASTRIRFNFSQVFSTANQFHSFMMELYRVYSCLFLTTLKTLKTEKSVINGTLEFSFIPFTLKHNKFVILKHNKRVILKHNKSDHSNFIIFGYYSLGFKDQTIFSVNTYHAL